MVEVKGFSMAPRYLSVGDVADRPKRTRVFRQQLPALVSMVEEGLGITLLSCLAIDAGAVEGHAIPLPEIPAASRHQVVRARRKTSPQVRRFKAIARILRETRQMLKHRK